MAEEKPVRVDEALYVNEGTLELLQRRIESEVKTGFLRSIGIPIGGAGVLAIAFALFSYIPNTISSFIEKDETVRHRLQEATQKAAVNYLNETRGQEILQEQVKKAVGEQVKAAVKTYFTDPQGGQKFVMAQVNASIEGYFTRSEAGRKFVQEFVNGYLTSGEGKELIRDQVKRLVEPTLTSLLEPIKENLTQLVIRAEHLPEVKEVQKGTIPELDRFLRSPEAARLKAGSGHVALTKRTRQGPLYDADTIKRYLDTLQREFGEKFRNVILTDRDGTFIARIDHESFRSGLQHQTGQLMRILNAWPQDLSREGSQVELNRIFGTPVSDAIPQQWTVEKALRAPVWGSARDPRKEVAVLGEQGRFIGTTTRDRLMAAIFASAPKKR